MFEKVTRLFGQVDMTEGKPWRKIVVFTFPMLIGNVAQQLYNTVDSIVVGKYVGDNALAAVGSASPIFNLLLVLFVGIAMGAGIMVSQYYGSRDRENLSKTIGTTITLTAVASVLLMLAGSLAIRPVLVLLDTPPSIIDWCTSYLLILLWGIAGLAYYNILCGILRGLGDSLSALVYLLVATVLNIVLDIWFVAGLGMEVAGVALATVIAQLVSAALCILKLRKMTAFFDMKKEYLKPDRENIFTVIRLGLPSGLTQAIFSLAMVVVQSLTNSFGEMIIAANVIIMRVDGFAMMPNFSFGTAMTTYAGQNVGAKQYDRVKQITRAFMIGVTVLSLIFYIPIQLAPKTILSWFIKDAEIVSQGVRDFRILFSTYIVLGFVLMVITLMQSLGKASKASVLVLMRQIILFVPLAIFLPQIGGLGVHGVFLAPAVTDLIILVLAIVMLAGEFRNLSKLAAQTRR